MHETDRKTCGFASLGMAQWEQNEVSVVWRLRGYFEVRRYLNYFPRCLGKLPKKGR